MPHPSARATSAALPLPWTWTAPLWVDGLRRHPWVLTLAAVLLASWALGRSVSTTLAVALERPLRPWAAEETAPPSAPVGAQPDATRLSGLFGVPLDTAPALASVEATPSTLPLRLLGTLRNDDSSSLAVLEQSGQWRTRAVMVGEEIAGATVIAIERESVVLLHDGRAERIDMHPVATLPSPRPTGPAPVTVGRAADGHFEIPRVEVERLLGDLNGLMSQVRLIPAFENGKARGFKVLWLQPGSVLTRLGLERNDVLTHVNGTALTSADAVLDLFTRLREARRIDLQVDRRGTPVRTAYTIY